MKEGLKIKVDFTSLKNIKFLRWCEFVASGKNLLEFFAGMTQEEFTKIRGYDAHLISDWLSNLGDAPILEVLQKDVTEKTLRQKLDAVMVCKKYADTPTLALPYLCAIFEQEDYDHRKCEEYALHWGKRLFIDAYPIALAWLKSLQDYEARLKKSLKEIKVTEQQLKAGVKDLERWGDYSVYDELAGGDILKHAQILDMSLSEITYKIIYKNHIAHYLQNINRIYTENANNNNRKNI